MSKLQDQRIIPAINYHLWSKCNSNCKFCFGHFQNDNKKQNVSKEEAKQLLQQIINAGFIKKITFSGGEPTLCPWLPQLMEQAKDAGLVVCVVTNGSLIDEAWLKQNNKHVDWIALSIDAVDTQINNKTGRSKSVHLNEHYYIQKIALIKKYNCNLKINTVVSQYNLHHNLNNFIKLAKPHRWKLMQALPIEGENNKYKSQFQISITEFDQFKQNHEEAIKFTTSITETNNQMTSSYLMVDPLGRFFDNSQGNLNYSKPILEVGFQEALKGCSYSMEKFIERGGLYSW